MSDAAAGPAGLMVLHLWVEPGSPTQPNGSAPRLRARITRAVDVGSGDAVTTYASTRTEVLRLVDDWLAEAVTPR